MKIVEFYIKTFSGLSKDIWYIALIYLINRCGEMVIPFMGVYLTQELDFSKTSTSIVLFSFGAGALLGSNIGGYLTDRIGNFRVMIISLTGTGIAFMCIVYFKSLLLLSVWMMVSGMFSSMFSPAAFSAVSLWGNPDNQARGFSLLRMAINLGVAIGPAIGGYLAHKVGYNWLFIVDGMTCLLAVGVLILILKHRDGKYEKPKNEVASPQSPFKDFILIVFLLCNLINMIAFFQILFSVPVYFKEDIMMNEKLIGYFFTANGLLVLLLEMPMVYLIDKTKRYIEFMMLGAILIGIGYACLSIFSNPLMAIILYSLLVALGEVINFPFIPTLAMTRAKPENQGKFMGVVSMMFAMAFALAPISGLPIIDHTGYINYWWIAAGLSVLSGVCLWFLKDQFGEKKTFTDKA